MDLCSDTLQIANFTGGIAFAVRGNCTFAEKAWLAQRLGAIGIVVADDRYGSIVQMGIPDPPTNASRVTIPSVIINLLNDDDIMSKNG
jgi:hypothetical protein